MSDAGHWERVYRSKAPDQVSWYRPHLDRSLAWIERAQPGRDAHLIDVGGGEATLVDDLLATGYRSVDVLDLSATALEVARGRLGPRGDAVGWLVGDVTTYPFAAGCYDVWHDRAVFHFLTAPAAREAYVAQVARAVRPGGHVLVATFAPDGPEACSGLPVARYDADALHAEFGPAFTRVAHEREEHITPWGTTQAFVYCLCRV